MALLGRCRSCSGTGVLSTPARASLRCGPPSVKRPVAWMNFEGQPSTAAQATGGTLHPPAPGALPNMQSSASPQPAVEVDEPSTSGRSEETSSSSGVTQHFWSWKHSSRLRYFRAGTSGPPLILLHGFGVGAFHYENNMEELSKNHRVWAVELMGQGESWPAELPQAGGDAPKLFFGAKMWCEQLSDFIAAFVGEPAYLVGNSLGGYLAVCLAYRQPELVRGLVLLNATPFWSARPALASTTWGLWKFMDGWYDGSAPAPEAVTDFIKWLAWSRLQNLDTIRNLIKQVYISHAAADDRLVERIAAAARHPAALHAFASIMLSPGEARTFADMLEVIRQRGPMPICLAYGAEDPWVRPLWAKRIKRQVPEATYLEVSPAGHCPHHECPTAINAAIEDWVTAVEAGRDISLPLGASWTLCEADGRQVTVSHLDGRPTTLMEQMDDAAWALLRLQRRPVAGQTRIASGGTDISASG